ncbi:MAG: tRNA uridine-5-carboxymethylaminomethyl(34) synthesis GTPase MnmE [Candidatus Aminicenantes bacterium]|nr:tRNA uridine-5-carboxymethylaminomethyl(34) synthesis GTPase MnmE [Candidatus Aminicenantes bacterium]
MPRAASETIIAVSTPPGYGGIGIVRISGPKALAVAARVFRTPKKRAKTFPARHPIFGHLFDFEKGTDLDEAVLTFFPAPHSYTREDVVEISCHGSPVILEEAVRLGAKSGAREAHPGEFTLRAFLSGRIDLLQAEAVDDLIRAATLTQARISSRQLAGSLSGRVGRLRESLIGLLARLEAGIEFPDEALGVRREPTLTALKAVRDEVEELVTSYDVGRALGQGLTLAIVGRPNVGKSTLFNALLGEERAIVTPFPGTTRDFLRERMVVRNAVFNLVDMAGLSRPSHPVEKKGVEKGRRIAREADGVLVVFDGSRPLSQADLRLLEDYREKKAILILNKADLKPRAVMSALQARRPQRRVVKVSALYHTNLERLREAIFRTFVPEAGNREEILLHARQKHVLAGISEALGRATDLIEAGHPDELCAEEVRTALTLFGRLSGEVRTEEVIEDIFRRFCVGK